MHLHELQQWVSEDWERFSKKKPDECLQLIYLFEELGEMAEAIRKHQGDKERKNMKADVGGEMGDVLITLVTIANYYNIDLGKAVEKSKRKIIMRHKKEL